MQARSTRALRRTRATETVLHQTGPNARPSATTASSVTAWTTAVRMARARTEHRRSSMTRSTARSIHATRPTIASSISPTMLLVTTTTCATGLRHAIPTRDACKEARSNAHLQPPASITHAFRRPGIACRAIASIPSTTSNPMAAGPSRSRADHRPRFVRRHRAAVPGRPTARWMPRALFASGARQWVAVAHASRAAHG